MSLNLFISDTCPECGKPTMQANVESHPERSDIALQNFRCTNCGFAKTKTLSLRPRGAPPEVVAQTSQ
jgi:C4-type Zn-finger protein